MPSIEDCNNKGKRSSTSVVSVRESVSARRKGLSSPADSETETETETGGAGEKRSF